MKFHEMTAPELRRVPRDRSVVVLPIAACEQHSDHLPTLTDTLLVTAVAEGVEEHLRGEVLLLPTLWLGASHHHLRFGGTLSVPVDIHVTLLAELLTPLLDDGYLRVLLLNGHGGNIDTMQTALRRDLNPLFHIHAVEVVDALPRTASHKVMRRLLRDRGRAAAGDNP